MKITEKQLDAIVAAPTHDDELIDIKAEFEAQLDAIARTPFVLTESALDRSKQRDHSALFVYSYGDANDLEQMMRARQKSRSELDLEFAALLAEYATREPELIAAVMAESPHARPKWTTGRGTRTWLEQTIARALRDTRDRNHTTDPIEPDAPVETESLDVTVAELATHPELLQLPESVSPWLTWRGQLTLLVGREKLAGKSTLAASDAARAAKAGYRVLWVDAEQGHNRVVSRFVELGAPLDRLMTLRRWPQSWAEVEDVITRREPDAVYIDSVSSFLMAVEGKVPDTSEGEKWQALVGRFKRWTALGPKVRGVCGLLHATKSDGNYRGSTGIGAAPDVILTMRPDPDDTARRWLDCIGRWGFPSRCVRFGGEAKGYSSVDVAAGSVVLGPRLSQTRRKVLAALKPGTTWTEWRDAWAGNPNTFAHAVAWLRTEGFVKLDDATGKYCRDEFTASQALPESTA
jgi:hypothetical protein